MLLLALFRSRKRSSALGFLNGRPRNLKPKLNVPTHHATSLVSREARNAKSLWPPCGFDAPNSHDRECGMFQPPSSPNSAVPHVKAASLLCNTARLRDASCLMRIRFQSASQYVTRIGPALRPALPHETRLLGVGVYGKPLYTKMVCTGKTASGETGRHTLNRISLGTRTLSDRIDSVKVHVVVL
jgi:hypothetical protein